jgi:ABC-type sugar transport system substrate-binding protein
MSDPVQGGYQVTQNTLSANPTLSAIYAINDPEGEGAVQALNAAGKNGVKDVFLVGFNGDHLPGFLHLRLLRSRNRHWNKTSEEP